MREIRGDTGATAVRIAIVAARFNELVTAPLVDGALAGLTRAGVDGASVSVVWVPGAFEIPLVAERLAVSHDAVICLGAVIRGETSHFELVANEAARGIADVSRRTGTPCIFEVLATDDLQQAQARAGGSHGNKGYEAAMAALEMVDVLRRLDREPTA